MIYIFKHKDKVCEAVVVKAVDIEQAKADYPVLLTLELMAIIPEYVITCIHLTKSMIVWV